MAYEKEKIKGKKPPAKVQPKEQSGAATKKAVAKKKKM